MQKDDIVSRLGIQSYCFREFKEAKVLAEKTLECGVDRLELFSGHCDPQDADADAFIDELKGAGIGFDAWFVNMPDDPDAAALTVAKVKAAGCSTMVVASPPADREIAARLCRESGITMSIHNHGRGHEWGSPAVLADLFAANPEFLSALAASIRVENDG